MEMAVLGMETSCLGCLGSLMHWDEFVKSLELQLHPLTEPLHWSWPAPGFPAVVKSFKQDHRALSLQVMWAVEAEFAFLTEKLRHRENICFPLQIQKCVCSHLSSASHPTSLIPRDKTLGKVFAIPLANGCFKTLPDLQKLWIWH